jgi:photosystem II PsbU protein
LLGGKKSMKRLVGVITILFIVFSSWIGLGQSAAQAIDFTRVSVSSPILAVSDRRNPADTKLIELGTQLDLNNSDVREFRKLRGFYPGLASKIVQNAPYEKVEDVLEIPGLSQSQQQRLQANLDKFIVTDPSVVFNAGDERYNPGVY